MTISQPDVNLKQATFASLTEIVSAVFYPHPACTGSDIKMFMTQAGVLDVDYLYTDGTWREVVSAQATLANDPVLIQLIDRPRAARVRWTPGVAPGTITVDGAYWGHGGH